MQEDQSSGETTPENPEAPAENTEAAAPTAAPTGPAAASFELRKSITDRITEKTKGIRSRLVDRFADIEIDKRAEALYKAFIKRDEVSRELTKMKKPVLKFTADGKPVEQLYEKKELDEIKKKQQELEKLEKAIDLALGEKADYSLVKQLGAQ